MNMPDISLGDNIEEYLPAELVDFMQAAGEVAQSQGQRLYGEGDKRGEVNKLFKIAQNI